RLRGRAVIVGAGVVLAASYEAKAFGVRTAMGGRTARRLCPHAVVVPPRMSAYSEASKAVYRVFDDLAPLVEGLSIDEAFLDELGVATVGQVAAMSESALVSILGRAGGRQLHALAHNRDPRRVAPRRRRRSIGAQCALGRRRRSPEDVDAVLLGLVDRVTRR